jgi:hypothetical protein
MSGRQLGRIGRKSNGGFTAFSFAPAQVLKKLMNVFETSECLRARLPHFLDDRIGRHTYSPISSSGVQITGGS